MLPRPALALPRFLFSSFFVTPNAIGGIPWEGYQLAAEAYYSDGTLWNFTASATWSSSDTDGSRHFKLPVHLKAWGSVTIDMAKVMARGQADAEGHVIPARVRQGSAVFASPKGVTSPIKLAIWGAHFSARLGVAEACCLPY